MSPADARVAEVPFRLLSTVEQATLKRLGEIVVPGSIEAGLLHYIDHQLAVAPPDCMLMIKYLGVGSPYAPFYQGGLAAVEDASRSKFGNSFSEISDEEASTLVSQIATGTPKVWEGPPAAFFFFVIRSDAIDVRYGTQEGFADLGVPYMPHIVPPSNWGA